MVEMAAVVSVVDRPQRQDVPYSLEEKVSWLILLEVPINSKILIRKCSTTYAIDL